MNSTYMSIEQRNDSRIIYHIDNENLCKLGCFLTHEQALLLVDFADPQYESELSSLITIHDIIPQERIKTLLKSNIKEINIDQFSPMILLKQEV
jgi:hypothetical protein